MNNTRTIIGCLLMFISLVIFGVVLFMADWRLGALYLCFVGYRIGYSITNTVKFKF